MASGHEYRANRPNTWLLRPMLQSEDSPCQPGAVHTWPKADITCVAPMSAFGGRALAERDFRFGPGADLGPDLRPKPNIGLFSLAA